MAKTLDIAFIWHMHQPAYKEPFTGEYVLPWALLHSTKDYLDMALILNDFPDIHQTINIVPSLIEQIEDYSSRDVKDRYRDLSLRDASKLTAEDKAFILTNFFQSNWENMIKPLPRYYELLRKRGFNANEETIHDASRFFSGDEFRDLQLLFNLSWIDPTLRAADSELKAIEMKGRNFDEADKLLVLDKQIEITSRILPTYKEMQEKGLIEVSTTPYYHPIMPLLVDFDLALSAMPDIALPENRIEGLGDALSQIRRSISKYREVFGCDVRGFWPSEGSVSTDIIRLMSSEGIKWSATDEEILAMTLRRPIARDKDGNTREAFLYRPHTFDDKDNEIDLIFRDHVLSDLIGFEYATWDPEKASEDFIGRLAHIYNIVEDPQKHLVSIILDGENAWETYPNDGRDFFSALYTALSSDERFSCVTVSEHLEKQRPEHKLDSIYPGSWIDHNFKIWIGHPEKNAAWDLIAGARDALVKRDSTEELDRESSLNAWEALYRAEGSDWFWWYGDDHTTMNSIEFDALFRSNIKKVYHECGATPDVDLDTPILMEDAGFVPTRVPSGFINPTFDGEVTNYYEWLAAGEVERSFKSGAMHKAGTSHGGRIGSGLIDSIYYGFNLNTLFLRLDYLTSPMPLPLNNKWHLTVDIVKPGRLRCVITINGTDVSGTTYSYDKKGEWVESCCLKELAINDILEIGIPFELIGAKEGETINLRMEIDAAELGIDRRPARGFLAIEVPTKDYELINWMV